MDAAAPSTVVIVIKKGIKFHKVNTKRLKLVKANFGIKIPPHIVAFLKSLVWTIQRFLARRGSFH